MFGDQIVSLIRTTVPVGVGIATTWLARETGIVLDEDTSAMVTAASVGIVSTAYYAAVRWLEERWPVVGRLLGSSRAPHYPKPARTQLPRA